MVKSLEEKKSPYDLLITELPIIVSFSIFLLFRSLYSKLSLVEIIITLFALLPFLALSRFITIYFLNRRETENLTLINYLAFSGIPSYLIAFFTTLVIVKVILGKTTFIEIVFLSTAFSSGTIILSLISLGILIDEHFDPRKSKKRVDIVKLPVIVTIFSSISSVILVFSIILMKMYLNIYFTVIELIVLNILSALVVFITLKKIYSTIEKDIAKIESLLLENGNNNTIEEPIDLFSEQLKEIQKVIQEVKANYKLKESFTINAIENLKKRFQNLEKNFSTILEVINKSQKSKNLETTLIKYNLRMIVRSIANSVENLESAKTETLNLKQESETPYIKKIVDYLSNELETKTKISEILNSVSENLKKAEDKLSILYRDIPEFTNSTDKLYSLVEEIRNIGFKLNNISVSMDIELAKTKYEKQKLSVISQEIRKISESIFNVLSLVKSTEIEKYKVDADITLLLESFSSLDTIIKEILKDVNESLEITKKLLVNLKTTSDNFSTLNSSTKSIEEETNLIDNLLIKTNSIISENEKEISSFDEEIKKIFDELPTLKDELEEKIKEINKKIKELQGDRN